MILNLRGTSGSGKSFLLRQVMALYNGFTPQYITGRKQPISYLSNQPGPSGRRLYIPGHYETACGGCDTISTGTDVIFNLVRNAHEEGYDVLFEGLLITVEYTRTVTMQQEGFPLRVFFINMPLQVCLDSILERRRRKNPDAEPCNPKNTAAKHKQSLQAMARLKKAGVDAVAGTREEVLAMVKKELGYVPD